jgi:hypothetical protein
MGSNLMSLIKMLLLEKRIVVFSETASKVSQFIISILTLFPGSLLFKYDQGRQIKSYLKSINKVGLPLKLFNDKTLLLPSASIRDLKLLQNAEGYFIGTTNSFLPSKINADLVIDLDKGE